MIDVYYITSTLKKVLEHIVRFLISDKFKSIIKTWKEVVNLLYFLLFKKIIFLVIFLFNSVVKIVFKER